MAEKNSNHELSVIRVVAEPCCRCGKVIEVISPTWYSVHQDLRDPENYRMTYSYAPDESALCVTCCLASKTPEERPAWEHFLKRLLRRKQLSKVPDQVTLFHHRDHNTHVFERTNGIHHNETYFMLSRGEASPDWRVPTMTLKPDDGTEPTVHIWVGVDVTLEGVPASDQVTWNVEHLGSGQSLMQVVGWERSTHEDLKRLMEGTRFLYEGAGLWRGRPPGKTTITREEFLELYRQAREQCLQEVRSPTDNNLLLFLPFGKSTLIRYRKKWMPKDPISDIK